MTKTLKITLGVLLVLIVLFIGASVFLNIKIQNKINNFLENRLPETISQSHSSIDVEIFKATVTVSDVLVKLSNKSDTITHTKVKMDQLIIEDVSYWDYLFNDVIHIEDIKLKSPIITYYKDKVILNKESKRKAPLKVYKPIRVDELSIDNTTFTIFEKGKDSVVLHTANTTIEIDDLLISRETLLQKIPITYKQYEVEADSVFVKVSPYENLTVGAVYMKNRQATFDDLQLHTKYSKKTLSNIITKERDHVQFNINQLQISDIDFGFTDQEKLFVKSPKISIDKPVAALYRDKLVADDLTEKRLYSKMLREAPLDITIDEVAIKNGAITYTERVKEDNSGGTIAFKNMYATIYNASNTYAASQKTAIDIKAVFMKDTPLKADWDFDVNDTNDQFTFKAEIGKMTASDLNSFMQPNLKVQLEGVTNKTFMTINGTNKTSTIDMKMNYDDLKVNILNKKGNKKNKLISAIANIFIKKDTDKEVDDFREGDGTATRDETKSFFNYLWLNTKEGLINTLTGSGD